MSPVVCFLGYVVVVSLGLAVLELMLFVGVANIIAIPFTLFGPIEDSFYIIIGSLIALVIAGYGVGKLFERKYIFGVSALMSVLWAYAFIWLLTSTEAFTSVPSL